MPHELTQKPVSGTMILSVVLPEDLVRYIDAQVNPSLKSMKTRSSVARTLITERAIELGYDPPDGE